MSYQTASNLCYFGTTNPKIREAITALLAGQHASACELLATAFMDTKEELDRQMVAQSYAAEEQEGMIAAMAARAELAEEQLEEAMADAKHQKVAADAQKARAEAAEEENRTLSSKNYSLTTQLDAAEEELLDVKEQLSAANSYNEELTSEMWDLYAEQAALNKELKESRGSKSIWGGGVVALYDDEDKEETAPVTPIAPISSHYDFMFPPVVKAEPVQEKKFKPLEFALNGCLVGCDLCAAYQEDGIDRSELEDDMEMVNLCTDDEEHFFYADGTPYNPAKTLSFAEVLVK